MSQIKVLQVGLSYKVGGIETYLINYQKQLDKTKVSFDYINVFERAKKEFFYEELCKYSKVYTLPDYRKHPIKFTKELIKLNKEEQYDVFHYNMNSACYLIPLLAAKMCKIKVIIAHSHNSSSDKGLLKKILHNFNKKIIPLFANTYFACSELAGAWFFNKKIRKSENYYIINNAINLEKFTYEETVRKKKRTELGISDDTIVIGHVGSFKKQKNHEFIIDIFNEYHKKNPNSKLLLVGIGPLFENIKEKINNLKMNNSVILLGQRSDTANLYQAMDIFLLPSLYEGLPLVGVEAQAVGLKCFFSDVITKEVNISDNVTYIPLKDSASEWAEQILNANLTNRKSVDASKFDIKENAKRLEEIYSKLMKKSR